MSVLCVIDMQPSFDATAAALNGVLFEIEKAKLRKEYIFIVEFFGCGETHPDILHAIKKYKKVIFVEKHTNDGSHMIRDAARKKKISLANVRICGVNLGFCVIDTVHGFCDSRRPPKSIEVLTNATSCSGGFEYSLERVRAYARDNKSIKVN